MDNNKKEKEHRQKTSFTEFANKQGKDGLASTSQEAIKRELQKRGAEENPFPLEVFPEAIKPFINALHESYDIPKGFIGLCILSVYSAAIGTAYTVSTNGRDSIYLTVWGCMVGMSSSGKSLCINLVFPPLQKLQAAYDKEWKEKTKGMSAEKRKQEKMDTIIFRDSHVPTVVRSILPDNPKGTLKEVDELLEWVNGMNQLGKKESTDEQFWLSSWNAKHYSGVRADKDKFIVERPFIGVIGGTQPGKLGKLFANGRDTSGFAYRLLFACEKVQRIAMPDPCFVMPEGWVKEHENCVETLYHGLRVDSFEDAPKKCILDRQANALAQQWKERKAKEIGQLDNDRDKEPKAGVFGKLNEYALRFAAILHLMDRVSQLDKDNPANIQFRNEEAVTGATMQRSLKLVEYFYNAAQLVYEKAYDTITAPPAILMVAAMVKNGRTLRETAALYLNKPEGQAVTNAEKQKMHRLIDKWRKQYPRVFQAYGE